MASYVIAGHVDDEDGTLYWSNGDGWGFLSTATVFTADEYNDGKGNLPLDDAARWVELPLHRQRLQGGLTMVSGYKESLRIFRDLLEPENLEAGLSNEYVRGGVELIADLFGIEGTFHAERIEQVLADLRAMPPADSHGTLNPDFNESATRFVIYVKDDDPDEEPNWRHKLEVMDHKYLDSDGLPITSIAGGHTSREAFVTANNMVTLALAADHCTF